MIPGEVQGDPQPSPVVALLGPTNTGKTHRAVERMLEHRSGMIGLPLRLLAREIYDRVSARVGEAAVALITGEEKRVPARPRYWVCTVESMPVGRGVDFLAVDEIQLAAHRQRGHVFTDRLLHARGRVETWFLGAWTIAPLLRELLPGARIETHPRYSDLAHAGVASLTSLPPRSAVVAFSAEKVYELAERLRRRRGGAAVVLGALSPRTRNAQVAMYQAGEVHYLVATDAIGMGLNMDVDHVAFAGLDKFDGREGRALAADELAQIAGRAGRFQRAGTFGTLREVGPLPPPVVQAIEGHAFPPLQHLVWRSSELDFSSPAALIAALRRPSPRPELRRIERADDFDVLLQLAASPEICRRASAPETVELLWEVCRIPDFRKLLVDSHVRLLARIFEQLSGPSGQIDEGWMARRIARLDDVEGDIDTLMGRLAFIRTWTYIAHQSVWVADPDHWQARTMAIEGELSDALHHQLTQRFVARRDRGWIGPRELEGRDDQDNPFRRLLALDLPHRPGRSEPEDEGEGAWAERVCAADHRDLTLEEGAISFEGRALARLGRGPDLLHPELLLALDEGIRGGARAQIHRRLLAWIRDAVADLLGPLATLGTDAAPALRGLAYQLVQGLGTIPRRPAEAQLAGLGPPQRRLLEGWGVRVGAETIYLRRSLRGPALALRAALVGAQHGRAAPPRPRPGAVSMSVDPDLDHRAYLLIGYRVAGPRALRVDVMEERLAELRGLAAAGPFEPPRALASRLGVARAELPEVLAGLGFDADADGRVVLRHRARERRPRVGARGSARPRRAGAGARGKCP